MSFRREKFVPRGGPDGGDGGHGGSVYLVARANLNTLLNFRFQKLFEAGRGAHGEGSLRTGKSGGDITLQVPIGTQIFEKQGEEFVQIADLTNEDEPLLIAKGGLGGQGNARYASSTNRAPRRTQPGLPGEEKDLRLQLKLLADVGLVGFPNAGKSTIISRISAAKPKIADYPFTTLVPNLGVITGGDTVFTMADVPGLIPGASEGKGLGLDFLRHIERCAVLVHVVDCATLDPGRDPLSDVDALEAELAKYTPGLGGKLEERPRVVVLNKIDVPEAAELAEFVRPELEARGLKVFEVSTASRKGLRELTFALAAIVEENREAQPVLEPEKIVLRPLAVDDSGFTVEVDPEEEGAFIVRGSRPERWIRQTDFGNDEAVGYLADRLERLGVEEKLAKLGARPGSPVTIGDVQFEWEPSTPSVAMHLSGRGTDVRLERSDRIGAAERKEARRIRRGGPDDAEGDDLDLDA